MVGYVVSILVVAIPTALAVAPLRGSWRLGQISWRLGMQINEVPVVGMVWVVGDTAFAAWQGSVTSPSGATGLVLAVLTMAGLVVILARGLRARSAVSDALAAGLGSSERVRVPLLRTVLAPLRVGRRDVVHRRNQGYGPAGRENLLDTYSPRNGEQNGACLVYFHGGGYHTGEKDREARALLYRLASQGWLCVSASYRRGRARRWPDALVDAHQVLAWTRAAAATGSASAPDVFVAGSSAGAHLAAVTALTPAATPEGTGEPGVVAGAVCLYGFYDTPTWIDRDPDAPSSPLDLVGADAPAFLLAHGSLDSCAAVDGARAFAARLREVSRQPVVYVELPGGQHTFDLYASPRFTAVIAGIEAFAASVRRRRPRR
ncbi:MAG TPA: alpha/beta hydrolase [Nocardioides sp.]|jgi:acetyl esterase/lipase|uniref:alpha/beta hydrolase n=1 Tax=Nocardioides sp. TaxID=35761 RepID=UPI002E2FC708|nr:alpha/beta hydrolase [Nocardioides sp.]HEX3929787.1 alpha/beta hydrolase [Nocardioides sp.]